jgi:hypothetical protein
MAVPGPTNGLHCGTRIGGISTKFTGLNSRGSSVILAWMEKHASHDMAATPGSMPGLFCQQSFSARDGRLSALSHAHYNPCTTPQVDQT